MLWLFRYINGFLTVVFYGDFPQKILNLSAQNRIFLWDSHLTRNNGITCCITVKDFKKLPLVLKKSGIRTHIIEKHGLPFKIHKNRKRIGIYVGLILFAVFLKLISNYVWIIDITGNQRVKETEILNALYKIGIKEGIKKDAVNPKNQREKLLLELDSLAWASLNIEGCRLTVNVTEIKENEKENDSPCNLKATTDGIIKKIDITSGNCIVKQGDAVKKGDVLVSGIIETANRTEFVASSGVITAFTEHKIELTGNFKEDIIVETGKTKKKRVLEFFGVKIPLYLGKETEDCVTELKINKLKLFGQNLPIKIYEKEFRYVEKGVLNLNRKTLEEKLINQLNEKIKQNNWENYEIKNIETIEEKNGLTVLATVSAEENIVYSEKILFSQDILETTKPE